MTILAAYPAGNPRASLVAAHEAQQQREQGLVVADND